MKIARYISIALITAFLGSCSSIEIKESVEINETQDWLIIGADASRTNISKSVFPLDPPFQLAWEYDADAGFSSNCLSASDGVLFVSTLRGEIFALNIENGKSLGRITNLGKGAFGTPAIVDKGIIATFDGDAKNSIISYDIEQGLEIWSRDIGMSKTSPVLYRDMILVSSMDNKVYNLNLSDGSLVWTYSGTGKYTPPKSFYTTPTVHKNLLVIGNTNGSFYAIDVGSGRDLWEFKTGGAIYSDASIYGERIYFGSDDNSFYSLDFKGNLIWKKDLQTGFKSSPSFFEDLVIVSAIDGCIYALDKNTGREVWKYKTGGAVWASPVVHKDKVFIGSFDMSFYCLDAATGNRLWSFKTDGRIRSTALIWKNFIFAASEDKNIYCFKSKN